MSTVDVRPAAGRDRTAISWLDSKHSFAFGQHYDPANTHHGLLVVSNDDRIRAGAGFETHPHRDMEIVTWVLSGTLVHQDSQGNSGLLHPGLAQRMSAGTGILHSEKNDAAGATEDVHLVQMWVLPDENGIEPGYEQREIGGELHRGGLVTVASGRPGHESAIRIKNRHAALHVARLAPGESVVLPDAPYLHVFSAVGGVSLEGTGDLAEGDAARITGSGGQQVTALDVPAEVLVWEMHAGLHP